MGRSVARRFHLKYISLIALLSIVAPCANALQLTVAWDSVAGATGYKVERSTNNLLYTEVASVSGTSYTDTSLASGSYWYRVRATNGTATSDYSNVASYASTDVAPAITAQPVSQTATRGSSVSFSVSATGSPAPGYQWQKGGVALSGATSSTLTFPSVTSSDAGNYSVVVTNSAGSLTSKVATLTVNAPAPTAIAPAITTQPVAQSVDAGAKVSFTVAATGTPAPTYQWRKDGAAISGATTTTFTLNSVSAADAGTYTVVATNSAGSVTSSGALLSVTTPTVSVPVTNSSPSSTSGTTQTSTTSSSETATSAKGTTSNSTTAKESSASTPASAPLATPGSRLVNASIRAIGGLGDQVLIVGFVIDQADKSVLLRAIGPGLAAFTTAATFTDPKLTVYSGSTPLVSNDNWGATAALKSAFKQTGAQLLDDSSKDAALVTTLGPKPYTMVINGSGPGMTLAEVYDLDSTGGRIVNIAARAQISTGDGVLIAGFAISGNAPKQVLLRGIGPSLTSLGISGALARPQIDLFHGTTRIDHNEGWGGGDALQKAFAKTGAFTLGDTNSKDAALLVTLDPGTYSVVVSGVGGSTGVALVEVYDVP
jgi:PKD repeat protein